MNELEECYVGKRRCPEYEIKRKAIDGTEKAQQNLVMKNMLWLLLRLHCATPEHTMPGWAGYVSSTGDVPHRLTTWLLPCDSIPYHWQQCLRFSEEASLEVGQEYVITSFDLGVCMKAYSLVWNYPNRYENNIIMIGTFHLACSYLKMIGKKMECSGLSDILLEAGLISPGSLSGVPSGKSYARAIHCHKVMVESLERLLLEQFTEKTEVCFVDIPQASKNLHWTREIPEQGKWNFCISWSAHSIVYWKVLEILWNMSNWSPRENGNLLDVLHGSCLVDIEFAAGCEDERLLCIFTLSLSNARYLVQLRRPKLCTLHGILFYVHHKYWNVSSWCHWTAATRSLQCGKVLLSRKSVWSWQNDWGDVHEIQGWKWILWCRTDGVTNQLRCISTMDQICFRASEVFPGHVQPGRYGGRPVCRQRTSW